MSRHKMVTTSAPPRGISDPRPAQPDGDGLAKVLTTGGDDLQRKGQAAGGRLSRLSHLWLVTLGEQHNARVRGEVHVAQFRVSVETEAGPHEGVEVPGQEIGQVEGAELL